MKTLTVITSVLYASLTTAMPVDAQTSYKQSSQIVPPECIPLVNVSLSSRTITVVEKNCDQVTGKVAIGDKSKGADYGTPVGRHKILDKGYYPNMANVGYNGVTFAYHSNGSEYMLHGYKQDTPINQQAGKAVSMGCIRASKEVVDAAMRLPIGANFIVSR